MAEEGIDLIQYKDISELKKELAGMSGKKGVSINELHDVVQRLAETMTGMLEVFGAAAEQMRLEESEHESAAKKHEMTLAKLDKIIGQNRTIAEGMVAVVDLIKERLIAPAKEREEAMYRPKPEPRPFIKPPTKPEWQFKPEQMAQRAQPPMPPPPMSPPAPVQMPPAMSFSDFGAQQMPPMQPTPLPDLDLEEPFPLEEEQKKKGLFGMFKK